jgi:hypothetical protein
MFIIGEEYTPCTEEAIVATVHDPVSKRTMVVSTTQPAVHVYTSNFLDGEPPFAQAWAALSVLLCVSITVALCRQLGSPGVVCCVACVAPRYLLGDGSFRRQRQHCPLSHNCASARAAVQAVNHALVFLVVPDLCTGLGSYASAVGDWGAVFLRIVGTRTNNTVLF